MITFSIQATSGAARAGRIETGHGPVETPAFMPVGTAGTVKAMTPGELVQVGAQIILANTYHLYLRPGVEVVERLGGLHRMMGWTGPILTDSGGFQVFSLRALSRVSDDGVVFQSHIDGSRHRLAPEQSVAIQAALGSDIAMALDHLPAADVAPSVLREAMVRTTAWGKRSLKEARARGMVLFGIVQGGADLALRREHMQEICAQDFDGFALGGLAVGEPPSATHAVLEAVSAELPATKPRYVMGLGRPSDLVTAIGAGNDLFDCVLPTRNARNGQLFTSQGRMHISNAVHRFSDEPIDKSCSCETCQVYCRGYLRHLYQAKEILYMRLATLHNLSYHLGLLRRARSAIVDGSFARFRQTVLDGPEGW